MKKLIFGCGYLGTQVAKAWIGQGDAVFAVTRTPERASDLAQQGIQPRIGDPTGSFDLSGLQDLETVLFAVGFDRQSSQSIRDVYVGGLQNVLDALPESLPRFIYISSTGVYSQSNGEWIDEGSACEPSRGGGKACLEAEQLLQAHPLGKRSIVLRLAGIYGPDRLPKLKDVTEGLPIQSAEDGYLNLIHVEDAAHVVLAAERNAVPPDLFLVSDGTPVPRGEFYRELARLAQAPSPRFKAPDPSSPSAARAASNKRVDNRRMREWLQAELRYPSYREGLSAILNSARE